MSNSIKLGILINGLLLISCGRKENVATTGETIKEKVKVAKLDTVTPVCKLKFNDILGLYANKSGFTAKIKVSEKDSSKIDFVFQINKGCVRKYSGTASKEEYYSENELNFTSRDSINKIEVEISMFFSEGKLSVAERTSEKEKRNDKCLFEGHLTKLK